MNKAIICGRLTRDPEIRYSTGPEPVCIARYTLAVNRPARQGEEQKADFISCVAFGKSGEFAQKYLRQGMKMLVTGHIQTGSYTDREGRKVYTTDVILDEQEFAESKSSGQQDQKPAGKKPEQRQTDGDGFMYIPDGVEDEGLPFG